MSEENAKRVETAYQAMLTHLFKTYCMNRPLDKADQDSSRERFRRGLRSAVQCRKAMIEELEAFGD